jgi:hypothetical protein
MGYDVIGDIHGQAGKLAALLRALGYSKRGRAWVPPAGLQAVFIGDLIDRGPDQVEVVDTVRRMIDAGDALCVMGNHEFNAIGWATERLDAPGEFLRRHSPKNLSQHREFLEQVGEGSALHRELLEWFRWLPPALDLGVIRVVHAWWHQPFVDLVASRMPPGTRMSDAFLHDAYDKGTPTWEAMEGLTKGLEVTLPTGHTFFDHGGAERSQARTKWWHENPKTFRDVVILDGDDHAGVPDRPLGADYAGAPVVGAPVFIGHYWMTGTPMLQSPKVACVDYSAARNGPLVAYRWDGEQVLDAARFVEAGAND